MLFMYFAVLQNPEDEPLFEEFYNKFYDTMFYIAKKHLHTIESAEDCAQEVMFSFAKNFHNITHDFNDKKLCNFIRLVAKAKAVDMYRKEKRHFENVVELDVEDFYNLSVKEFDVVDAITLRDAFNNIPEDYKFICYLKYYCNLSGKEISNYLNISQPLVRKRCMLGMQFVRKYVNGENNE